MSELKTIADLQPHPRNPREITPAALAGLGASIEQYGDLSGIVWNQRSGTLVCGHQRIKALGKKMNMVANAADDGWVLRSVPNGERFPIRVVDWPEEKHLAAMVVANSPHIAGQWLPELGGVLDDLAGPLEDTFFDLKLDELRADVPDGEPEAGLTEPDAVPELPEGEPTCKPGDLYQLGDHRLLCGDFTKAEDVARLMKGELAAAVVTDPPYGIGYSPGGGGGGGGIRKSDGSRYQKSFTGKCVVTGDNKPFDPRPLLSLGLPAILWGGNHYASRLPDGDAWLVWDKRRGTTVNDFADAELAWTNLAGTVRVFAHMWNGMLKDSERGDARLHPTQKPVALMLWCLGMTQGTILDPYTGSGTTIIAAEQLGRRCYAMEIEPRYVDVAVRRWEQFTGLLATLEKGMKT